MSHAEKLEADGRACTQCSGPLGRRNQTGYCVTCFRAHGFEIVRARNPEAFNRARSEGLKRKYREDPAYRERVRDHLAHIVTLPHTKEAQREAGRRVGLSRAGVMAQPAGCEARKQQARTTSAKRLAWCPHELRAEYLHLIRSKKIKKDEAKAIILAQHEANLRELRRRMGVTEPVPDVVPQLPRDWGGIIPPSPAVEAHRAERARIDALRQRRDLCPICGARSDIGCEHAVAA